MVKRHRLALAALLSLATAACTGGSTASTARSGNLSGGTLRVVEFDYVDPFDPQVNYDLGHWELFRCCLLRTLLAAPGLPADRGGSEVRPDLASAMPTQSDDGLTWTFHLKSGIHYAPPFDDIEIVAGDVVRALERMANAKVNSTNPNKSYNYDFYYSIIDGFDDYRARRAAAISGLATPDDHTLVVTLTAPVGYLGYLFALPASAPIPGGAAQGHDEDYERFLVASGPYMFEGAGAVDYSQPPEQQIPAVGYVPGRTTRAGGFRIGHLTLVRNPAWDPSTDSLRPAYPDRIEIDMGGTIDWDGKPRNARQVLDAAFDSVTAGRRDLVLDFEPPPDIVADYASDPDLTGRLRTERSNWVAFIAMNLAEPPFDELDVRKAVSLVIDKGEIRRRLAALDQPLNGVPASHIVPDSMEDGLLAGWAPTWSVTAGQDRVAAARAEMRRSGYDRDGDGRCDDPLCSDVTFGEDEYWFKEFFPSIRRDLRRIGITFAVEVIPRGTRAIGYGLYANRWAADFPDASDFFPILFSAAGAIDLSWLGASPEQLAAAGYDVTDVPSAEPEIERCNTLIGQKRTACWALLDQKLMEDVVPWVPILFETRSIPVSPRVVRYSFDQFACMPALDRIAISATSS